MARIPYSDEELADLRTMHLHDYLRKWGHNGRSQTTWGSKRNREGLHKNPGLDQHGNPWEVVPAPYVPAATTPGVSAPGVSAPEVVNIVGVQAGERPDVEAIKAKHSQIFRQVAATEERKRFQSIDISHGPALIALVSDVHFGAHGVNIDRVFAEQDLINNTPGAYTFLLGDIVDNMIVGRLRDYGLGKETTIPEEWLLFEHYVKRWKHLLAFVGGNHDAWSKASIGVDLHRWLVPSTTLYDTDDLRVTVNVGNRPVRFRLRHKWRGYSQYNKTHGQEKSVLFDDYWADILVGGHTHTGAMARELTHAGKRKIAVQLGSYKGTDDYAQREGFAQVDGSTAAAVIIMPDGSYLATGSLQAATTFMRGVYQGVA